MQGQTICLISVFRPETLSLGLNSGWSEAEVSYFLCQCYGFLAVVLVNGELLLFCCYCCLEISAKYSFFYRKVKSPGWDFADFCGFFCCFLVLFSFFFAKPQTHTAMVCVCFSLFFLCFCLGVLFVFLFWCGFFWCCGWDFFLFLFFFLSELIEKKLLTRKINTQRLKVPVPWVI